MFSGIIPICGNEDGLAAVLGHEIAHNVAHHASERMSQSLILLTLVVLLAWSLGVPDTASQMLLDIGFLRPGSRKQEVIAPSGHMRSLNQRFAGWTTGGALLWFANDSNYHLSALSLSRSTDFCRRRLIT